MSSTTVQTVPSSILSLRNLGVTIRRDGVDTPVLADLSIDLPRGSTVALLGESGSGKTLAASAILQILPDVARISSGSILFEKRDLLTLSARELQEIRGNRISMVFQEPYTSLNPLMQIGHQIGEPLRIHKGLDRSITREQVIALMDLVGIPDPRTRFHMYPHQLSGGVRQRVVVAMALACRPEVLLADEPTSSLDATVQGQIIDLLARLIQDLRMSVLLISHDLGVVASLADRVAVLYAGRIIEEGTTREVLLSPVHPYTQSLLTARNLDRSDGDEERLTPVELPGTERPSGVESCPMCTLCPLVRPDCFTAMPQMHLLTGTHSVRCFASSGGIR